jgi:hypothetical protein
LGRFFVFIYVPLPRVLLIGAMEPRPDRRNEAS